MSNNAISNVTTRSPLVVEEVKVSNFQKAGTKTAVLRQTVETVSTYPSKSVSSDLQDNVFGMEDFGFESQEYTSTRSNVAFIDVPENSTIESVQAKIDSFPKACLYRILSNEPILTNNQKYSITAGLKTMDDYANSQVVRFGEGTVNAGSLLLDNNQKVQYRAVFFSSQHKEDIDRRDATDNMYLSPEIEEEYNTVSVATVNTI